MNEKAPKEEWGVDFDGKTPKGPYTLVLVLKLLDPVNMDRFAFVTARLEDSIDEHQHAIEQADKRVKEAALAVIAAEVELPQLIEELQAVHARWCTLHAQLYWFARGWPSD
jgi:hypothetical protein